MEQEAQAPTLKSLSKPLSLLISTTHYKSTADSVQSKIDNTMLLLFSDCPYLANALVVVGQQSVLRLRELNEGSDVFIQWDNKDARPGLADIFDNFYEYLTFHLCLLIS
jgi:hypothetical protein